jgi:hypothetical protein
MSLKLISGGADGADKVFEKYARENNHSITIYNAKSKLDYTTIEIDNFLILINKIFLNRTYPTSKEYSNNLLRRNIQQAIVSNIMYAIGYLERSDDKIRIVGGTAWACYAYIYKNIDIYKNTYMPFYFYNQKEVNSIELGWYILYVKIDNSVDINKYELKQYVQLGTKEESPIMAMTIKLVLVKCNEVPKINTFSTLGNLVNYAGIGSRDLLENGKIAISKLYGI